MNPSPAGSDHQQPVWATAAAAEGWDHIHGGAAGGLSMHYHHQAAGQATNTAAASGKDWDLSWDSNSNQEQQQQQLYYHQHSAAGAAAHEDHHHHHHHHQHHQHGELKPLILPLSSAAGAPMRSYGSPAAAAAAAVMFPSSYGTHGYSHHNSSPLGGYNSAHGTLQHHRSGLLMEALNSSSGSANNSNAAAAALTLHHNGLLGGGGSGIPGLAGMPVAAADMSHIHEELRTFEQRRNFFGLMPMELEQRGISTGLGNYVKREEQLYPSHHSDWLHGRIGLNLGGRTYFSAEDSLVARFGNLKRPRLNGPGTHVPMCQAEGCTADLSKAKHYHRRHKVCEVHSKAPTVVANGQTQRFCQQCSRFHALGEFDDAKRSCRKRLADHNRRRRKPQPNANPPAAAGAETAAEAESGEQDPSGATHSSADTKPTPLLLKSSCSPSASRDDSDSKVSSGKNLQLQQATSGGTRADDKPFVATSHGSLLGSGHHSSVTTSDSGGLLSSAVSIQTSTSPPVLLQQHNNQQKRNDMPVYNSSNSNQSGPNLSLSSSFGSGSHGMIAGEQNKNPSSQSSIEQPSWLKSATTNSNVAARPLVKSQNFHDLISSEKDAAATTEQRMQLLNSGSSAAQVFSPSNRGLMSQYGGTRGGFNTTTGGWISSSSSSSRDQLGQLQGSSQGMLEGHQVLTLLESRPNINNLEHPSVAMEFMQQQPSMGSPDDVDDARSQQRQVDIKFHEMQSLRPFYGSTSNLL